MDAYIFAADCYCPDCTRKLLIEHLGGKDFDFPSCSAQDMLRDVLLAAQRDPDDEHTWDSDEFPKGPYRDGGGEADTPQHCGSCGVFLKNPLTEDGYAYVIEHINSGVGNAKVLREWRDRYVFDHYKGTQVGALLKSDWDESNPHTEDLREISQRRADSQTQAEWECMDAFYHAARDEFEPKPCTCGHEPPLGHGLDPHCPEHGTGL